MDLMNNYLANDVFFLLHSPSTCLVKRMSLPRVFKVYFSTCVEVYLFSFFLFLFFVFMAFCWSKSTSDIIVISLTMLTFFF